MVVPAQSESNMSTIAALLLMDQGSLNSVVYRWEADKIWSDNLVCLN